MSKRKTTHSTKGLRPPKKHHTKHAAKVYWPYLPLLVLLFGGMIINGLRPFTQSFNGASLAYATEMSRNNLLASTNNRRAANGVSGITLNSKLNQAAQNKAIDMRNKNYWSHNTPSGQEPWIFVDAVGYVYSKAGENLAYGYPTSDETVTGWMNSPSHRANMLDPTFTEVGFGFINASDYEPRVAPEFSSAPSVGNQTIVVAMYAKPYSSPQPATQPEPTPPTPQPEVQSSTNSAPPSEEPVEETPEVVEEPKESEDMIEDTVVASAEPITSESSEEEISEAAPVRTTLLTQLTSGNYLWATTAVSILGFGLSLGWLMKHFVAVRKIVVTGEHFVAHHPVFDLLVVGIIALAIYLTQGNGVVL